RRRSACEPHYDSATTTTAPRIAFAARTNIMWPACTPAPRGTSTTGAPVFLKAEPTWEILSSSVITVACPRSLLIVVPPVGPTSLVPYCALSPLRGGL